MNIQIIEAERPDTETVVLAHYRFQECDTCAAKAGSPTLCGGCIHNRTLIERYETLVNAKPPRV